MAQGSESPADAVYARRPEWAKGCISRADARYLHGRAREAADDVIVEIGTASGVSTAVLAAARAERSTSCRVASYDISPRYYADPERRTGDATRLMLDAEQLAQVEFRNPATALDARDDHGEDSLGFAFIDAAHKHPWPSLDLLALLPCLRPGAEVVLHDINLPLVNPDWQASGVKYLYDDLEAEKHADAESDIPNIGSVIVAADKESFRRQVLAVIDGHDPEVEVPEDVLAELSASS
jgi:predicted O-methyltransferase YrrM